MQNLGKHFYSIGLMSRFLAARRNSLGALALALALALAAMLVWSGAAQAQENPSSPTTHLKWLNDKGSAARSAGLIYEYGFDDGGKNKNSANVVRNNIDGRIERLMSRDLNGQQDWKLTQGVNCESRRFAHITATVCTAKGDYLAKPKVAETAPEPDPRCTEENPCSIAR